MRITDLITQDEFAWYFINFPPTTPAGDEKGQQITISILIVGFKGLNFDFKPSAFDMQMKLNGYKTNQKLVKKM